MSKKYRAFFHTVASAYVDVEADSIEEAEAKAYEEFDYPAPGWNDKYEFGDWEIPTKFREKDKLDIEEIEA